MPTRDVPLGDRMFVDCCHSGDTGYSTTTGISLASTDFTPSIAMTGLLLTAGSGNISIVMDGGGEMVLPFINDVTGSTMEVLRGYKITKIKKTGTTYNGYIFPVY